MFSKRLKFILPTIVVIAVSLVITNRVWAAPKFPTFEEVQQMISDALAPIQTAINDLTTRVGNVETTLSPIPTEIVSLQLSSATMSAAIADLQQRVAALEQPPAGLSDDFNGPNLNTDIWEFFPNGGTFSFENGFLVIPGGNAIPFFRARNNPFPVSGPFTVEFGIQYTQVNQSGSGVAVSLLQQQNTCDWSNSPVAFWQGNNFGLQVVRFGLTEAVIGSNPDLNSHTGKIVYDGEKYQVFRDGSLVYTSPPTARATGLWFGHFFCNVNAPWTGFKLDFIRVTTP